MQVTDNSSQGGHGINNSVEGKLLSNGSLLREPLMQSVALLTADDLQEQKLTLDALGAA